MTDACCAHCTFATPGESEDAGRYLCRRFPPQFQHPTVDADDWCGEYRVSDEAENRPMLDGRPNVVAGPFR